jgi:ribosomal protein L37AE/L43A
MAGKLASRVRELGEAEFQAAYGTEERCRAAVEELRWPEGFVCPVCGGREGTRLSTRPKIQCASCRHQASSTAGTIFAGTKLPLTRWFLAIRLIATAAERITSVELGRRLGIKQTNAWALKQKLLRAMEHDDWRSPGDRRPRKRKLLPAKMVRKKRSPETASQSMSQATRDVK